MLLYISNNVLLCLIFISNFLFFIYLYYAFFLILVIFKIHVLFGLKMNKDDVCLVDCATTHTILRNKIYFLKLTLIKGNVSTISGTTKLVEGSIRVSITLPNGKLDSI